MVSKGTFARFNDDVSVLIEGGGSETRAAVCRRGRESFEEVGPTCNPHSVGRERANQNLCALIERIQKHLVRHGACNFSVCLCLSSIASQEEIDVLISVLKNGAVGFVEQCEYVIITNDVTPLLFHDGDIRNRVIVMNGTGTGYCAYNKYTGEIARASAKEYLLADEGGSYDIGLRGLRATVRQNDGRGPQTALTEYLTAWSNVTPTELFEFIYSSSEQKFLIASFAKYVAFAADDGDGIARSILDLSATEMRLGVDAVARRADLGDDFDILLCGSNLTRESAYLRSEFLGLLGDSHPRAEVKIFQGSLTRPLLHLQRIVSRTESIARAIQNGIPFRLLRSERVHLAEISK